MRLHNVYLGKSKLILLIFLSSLTACQREVVPVIEPTKVAHPPMPRAVQMQNVTFKVVTKDNINSVINEWKKIYGEDFTFLIMHAKDYEASVSNFEELRRYIAQQREIIVYYRKVIP